MDRTILNYKIASVFQAVKTEKKGRNKAFRMWHSTVNGSPTIPCSYIDIGYITYREICI